MYCSLDKLDVLGHSPTGGALGVQTDPRSAAEIEAEPELSVLFALARVLNARQHLREQGEATIQVRYALVGADPAPAWLADALAAAGAVVDHGVSLAGAYPDPDLAVVGQLADEAFRKLARRTAARVGSRDPAMALGMLEAQTRAQPIAIAEDEVGYWTRVLELAALLGEVLRARVGGRWVETTQAVVPFGFQLVAPTTGVAELFPTNRAQRYVDGDGESLLKLVAASEEMLQRPPDAATGRLMPSLRARRSVDLDDVAWQPLLGEGAPEDAPIVVCGVDGEITFGMMRREALQRPLADALATAVENLTAEAVDQELVVLGELRMIVVTGGFYAAEKVLDRGFMTALQAQLGARALAAATPVRGELLVCADVDAPAPMARFAAFVRARFADGGSRQIADSVLLVEDGRIVGCLGAEPAHAPERDTLRAQTEPATPRSFWRRLFGRHK